MAPVPAEPGKLDGDTVKTERGDYRPFYANVRDAVLGEAELAVPSEAGFAVVRLLELARVSSKEEQDGGDLDEANGGGALPRGFLWGAVRAGIKASGNLDVAVAVAPQGAQAAAVFTRNQVVAAPVTVGRRHLEATGGRVTAVLVNAGNANCATGEPGIKACVETCRAAAEAMGCLFDEVFPTSTGIIGVPLPADKVIAALPAARESWAARRRMRSCLRRR